ncbi:hypothetical protein LLH23_01950 [bacterium]|nr:hypothetical protein [bacterium]
MRVLRLLVPLLLCLPAVAAREADAPALQAIVAYGQAHFDAATGLVKGGTGLPDIPEASAGTVAACLATGQNLDQARLILGKILDTQAASGAELGHFPWQAQMVTAAADGTPLTPHLEAVPTPEATLYAAPLLAYALRHHADTLGADLTARLRQSLLLADKALARVAVKPQDDARFLLRVAARATIAAALGADAGGAVGEVNDWLRLTTRTGLPAGHSATFDTVRYVSLKWIRESLPEERRAAMDQALTLAAVDLAGRVHPAAAYVGGALTQGFASDYVNAAGFPSYVLATDFGLPLPAQIEPYLAAAVLPQWRAPESIVGLTATTGLRRTRSPLAAVRGTDTYIAPHYSLGTMSGEVGPATIPIFCTFARSSRPTMYFYCDPAPCTIQSVQADNLAVCSFNFDDIAIPKRVQASLRGVLGAREGVKGVYCYGVPWNGQPTAVGELESVAVETAECYVGLTLTRTGPSGSNQGAAAKPAVMEWSGPEESASLLLTIYARPQQYVLPKPMHNLRAGVVIEVVSRQAYPTLADFTKHLGAGRLKQVIKSGKERLTEPEKPRDPNVLIPEPRARGNRAFRVMAEQTVEYTLEGRSLKLVEDLLANEGLEQQIDGVTLDPKFLWESEFFKWEPALDLAKTLEAFLPQP